MAMVPGAKLRSVISSIMRRRSGVMACSRAEVRRGVEVGNAPHDVSAGAGAGACGLSHRQGSRWTQARWEEAKQTRRKAGAEEWASLQGSTAKRFRSTLDFGHTEQAAPSR